MPTDGLAGQHHRVRAVEHRVGDVGGLGAGGPRVLDHRLQHLGGDDDGFRVLPCHLDRALLHQRHLFERQLHAEVAARDHDRVERQHDRLEIVDRLGLLELGDHGYATPDAVHHLVHQLDVGRRPHERQRDQVDTQPQRELEVLDVLVGHRRHRHVHAGQRQTLVVGDRAALGDRAHHVVSVDPFDDQHHLAVVDEQAVPRRGVVGELLVRGGHPVVGALAVLDGDAHGVAALPERMAGSEPAEPDLRALQIGEDADRPAGDVGCGAHAVVGRLVVGVVAVAEVQARDVHAGLDQCPDHLVGVGGRAEGADDLSASIHEF